MGRRISLLVFYAFFFLLLGRNLSFLPTLPSFPPEVKGTNTEALSKKITNYIHGTKDTFSVYYKNLKTGEEVGIDENKALTGASLNKLVIVSYLYKLASEGKVDLEDSVVVRDEDIQDYGTGSLRYEEPGQTYSVRKLAQLTMEQSDNTAAHLLGIRLGTDSIQDFARSLGMLSTDMSDNKITARDTGILLEKIYTRKIANEALTRELLDFMKDTDFEDRLPLYIGKKATVYHKTGDAVRMVHDVGIVVDSNSTFILSVLSSDVQDEKTVKDEIGKIAEIVYEES